MTNPKLQKKSRKVGEDPLVVFCRSLPGATEDVKWGKNLIFSVGGRMFAGFPHPGGDPIGFKVDPLVFDSLVGHNGVIPAPYMAKHSWVNVTDRKKLPLNMVKDWLRDSHRLIVDTLSMKARKKLGMLE
jgi:predicted DNA-binding protein (MmcQ/YjbR family)